jgi:hypothetical protein
MNAIAFTREERALARVSKDGREHHPSRRGQVAGERSAFVPGMTVPVCPDLRRTAEVPIPKEKSRLAAGLSYSRWSCYGTSDPCWGDPYWGSEPDGSDPAAAGRAFGRRPAADRVSGPDSGSAGRAGSDWTSLDLRC